MPSSALMTAVGRNKEAVAMAEGKALTIAEIAWGDGDRIPSGGETSLLNEVGRKSVQGSGVVDGVRNGAFFEVLLDIDDGPFVIREAGLFDNDGDLIAVCYYDPPVNKPRDTATALLRVHVVFSDLQNLLLKVESTDAFVPVERKVIAGNGLRGGGDLSADVTLGADFASVLEARAGGKPDKIISPLTLAACISDLLGAAPSDFDTLGKLASKIINPTIVSSEGSGGLLMQHSVSYTVANGQITIAEAGLYQIAWHRKFRVKDGSERNIGWWSTDTALNGIPLRESYGINADQTGATNHEGTTSGVMFRRLSVGDVLSHRFTAHTQANIAASYIAYFDLIKVGEAGPIGVEG